MRRRGNFMILPPTYDVVGPEGAAVIALVRAERISPRKFEIGGVDSIWRAPGVPQFAQGIQFLRRSFEKGDLTRIVFAQSGEDLRLIPGRQLTIFEAILA